MSLMMTFGEKQTRRFLPEYRVRGSAVCYASHHNGGVVVEEFRVLPPSMLNPRAGLSRFASWQRLAFPTPSVCWVGKACDISIT